MLDDTSNVIDALGVVEDTVFRKTPKQCLHCECRKFDTLELVGVHDKPLFYECVACGTLHLRYKRGWVEKQLKKLDGLFTNPNHWEEPEDPKEYN